MKILGEKALSSSNYKIFILLLDMSKAFDTVRRNDIFEVLKEIVGEDEIHMMNLGNKFTINIGVPQGDCLRPILFIIHLAAALRQSNNVGMPK